VRLIQTRMSHVSMSHVSLSNVSMRYVSMSHVSLSHVSMSHVSMGLTHMTHSTWDWQFTLAGLQGQWCVCRGRFRKFQICRIIETTHASTELVDKAHWCMCYMWVKCYTHWNQNLCLNKHSVRLIVYKWVRVSMSHVRLTVYKWVMSLWVM